MSSSDESDQSFCSAVSHMSEEDSIPEDGLTDADPAAPFLRTSSSSERSRLLTEAENQVLNEKIDRLVAVIQAGRPLRFSPDPQTGDVDISIAHERSNSDDGRSDVEADIVASPENFGNVIRAGSGRRRILSPNSVLFDSADSSKVTSNFSSSAWENALALIANRSAVEHGSEAQVPPPVRKTIQGEVRGAVRRRGTVRRHGKYITYRDKNDVKVAAVASIPLDFNKPPRTLTPSIHSTGSDLDCSSPLFEKSLHALVKETSLDLPRSEDASQDLSSPGIGDSVSDWLEHVETPTILGGHTDAARKRQAIYVFRDGGKRAMVHDRERNRLTASETLKDVSNLRRPGYLQHNSFAQTNQVDKRISNLVRPRKSGIQTQRFGGANDVESRRSFIEANHSSGKKEGSTTLHRKSTDKSHSMPHIRRRRHKYPSPQKSNLQDPNRTADFDLALARLEGRAPPQQFSPIRRYADDTGLYGPDVLVERRRLRHRQPVPMRSRPFGPSTAQRFEKAVAEGDVDGGGKRRRGSG